MKKMRYFVIGICAVFCLLAGKGFPALAQEGQEAGRLTISFENHAEYEATFWVYEAARLENGRYTLTEDFAELAGGIDFNQDFTSPEKRDQMEIRELKEIIEKLSEHVKEKKLEPDAELAVKGTAALSLKEEGIYLLIPLENDRLQIEAFLAQVPAWEEGTKDGENRDVWNRNVEAHPKVIPKEEESAPPEKTTEAEPAEEPESKSETESVPADREPGGFWPGIRTGDEAGARIISLALLAAAMLLIILYVGLRRRRKDKEKQ